MTRSYTSTILILLLAALVLGFSFLARDRDHLFFLVPLILLAGGVLYALWRRNDSTMGQVIIIALFFRLLLVWLPPSLSDDAYRYVWDGLVQVEGHNPYRYQPEDPALLAWQDEPIYEKLNSKSYYSVYPPFSQMTFAFGALFYDQGWVFSYYVIKVVLVLFEWMAVLLLARMVDARSLMLYAWNPLVLIETAGQAHTESLLLFFLVFTVYLTKKKHGGWASVMLACAGWVKLYPFVLFPFLWRRFRWRAVWPGAVVIVLIAAPYAASYVLPNAKSSLDLYARLFEFNAGLYYGVKKVFLLITGDDWSKQIGPAFRMLFLVGLPVIYLLDARFKWPLSRAFLVTLGMFLILTTTVHPWYLLSVLLLSALLLKPAWHWFWIGLLSLGTYLLYVEGPYWPFVILGWTGWLVLVLAKHAGDVFQWIQRQRARRKVDFISPYLPRLRKPSKILDLGAGEGYVGDVLRYRVGAHVVLADVLPMNRTQLPHKVFDGKTLPFGDNTFDLTVLYFVLHHAEDQEQVLREALRVSRERVLIVESIYEGKWDHRLLTMLDRLANRLRSGGKMRGQEENLRFRTVEEWRELFGREGAEILVEQYRGRWIHKQALFVVVPSYF